MPLCLSLVNLIFTETSSFPAPLPPVFFLSAFLSACAVVQHKEMWTSLAVLVIGNVPGWGDRLSPFTAGAVSLTPPSFFCKVRSWNSVSSVTMVSEPLQVFSRCFWEIKRKCIIKRTRGFSHQDSMIWNFVSIILRSLYLYWCVRVWFRNHPCRHDIVTDVLPYLPMICPDHKLLILVLSQMSLVFLWKVCPYFQGPSWGPSAF